MITIDRSLPISIHVQIVGAIEYGVMAGKFRGGEPLPSVRALSRQLKVSPLTVSKAYQELQELGLICSEHGKGTFVRLEQTNSEQEKEILLLREDFQRLLTKANLLGVSSSFFIEMVRQQNDTQDLSQHPFKMMMVGNSNRMSREYVATIKTLLPEGQVIDVCSFDEFEAMSHEQIHQYGFYLTLPHCVARIRKRVEKHTPVLAPYLIPSELTRRNLAGLPSESNVLLVSRFANFLPAMLEGVKSFAPHLGQIEVFAAGEKHLEKKIKNAQVLIYSTGCHHLVSDYLGLRPAFEYIHVPEPRYLKDVLQPAYFKFCRQIISLKEGNHHVS